jgi:hypothetical protein
MVFQLERQRRGVHVERCGEQRPDRAGHASHCSRTGQMEYVPTGEFANRTAGVLVTRGVVGYGADTHALMAAAVGLQSCASTNALIWASG